jgi:cytoskeletal protein CcmA (bactofilin family)
LSGKKKAPVPAPARDNVDVTCPKCGNVQQEPRTAYSTRCRKCHEHFRLDSVLNPLAAPDKPSIERKQIVCFQCGTTLDVAVTAESTMCKRCSSHVDLRDYEISQTVSKNFRTHGRLIIEAKGYVLNTDSHVGDAVIKGKLIGKIVAERSLEIYSNAKIQGTIVAGRLVVPAGNHFRWADALKIGAAEIGGELVANLQSAGTVLLRSSARLFGDVHARNLVVEAGAVFVGAARIGAAHARD